MLRTNAHTRGYEIRVDGTRFATTVSPRHEGAPNNHRDQIDPMLQMVFRDEWLLP